MKNISKKKLKKLKKEVKNYKKTKKKKGEKQKKLFHHLPIQKRMYIQTGTQMTTGTQGI